jgi:hypothetical protein
MSDTNEPRELHAYETQLAKDMQGHEAFADKPELNDMAREYISLRQFKNEAGKMVKIPDENSTDEERSAYYKARGIPSAPADYKLEAKLPDGVKRDDNLNAIEGSLRAVAAKAKLEPAQANEVYGWFIQMLGGISNANKAKQTQATDDLKKDLGEDNMRNAEKALAKYGGEEYAKQVFSNPAAHAGTIKAFVEVAKAISEDSLTDVDAGNKTSDQVTWEDRFPDMKRDASGKIVEVKHG